MTPAFDPTRFLDAQAVIFPQALDELRRGKKRSHWMWFIFPQLAQLGHSPTSQYYGLNNLSHARAYLSHPELGTRLRDCVKALNEHEGLSAEQILGFPDCLKLHSCLTLFHEAEPDEAIFRTALDRYYDSEMDVATLRLLDLTHPESGE